MVVWQVLGSYQTTEHLTSLARCISESQFRQRQRTRQRDGRGGQASPYRLSRERRWGQERCGQVMEDSLIVSCILCPGWHGGQSRVQVSQRPSCSLSDINALSGPLSNGRVPVSPAAEEARGLTSLFLLFVSQNISNDLGKLAFPGLKGLWLWPPA